MSLYLMRRGAGGDVPECWEEIERAYQRVESLFDHLQLIYRPMGLTMVRCSLCQLIKDHEAKWRTSLQSKGRALELHPPEREVAGDLDPIQFGIGLDAMAKWRAEAGEPTWQTRISWRTHDGCFEICWEEFPAASAQQPVFSAREAGLAEDPERVRRADSLAILLVDRILAAHRGRLERAGEGSMCWTMRWPLYRS